MNADLILPCAIGASGAVLGAIAGGCGTYLIEELKIKTNEDEQRKQVYSQLWGNKYRASQSYASYFNAYINYLYDDRCCELDVIHEDGGAKDIVKMTQNKTKLSGCQESIQSKRWAQNIELKLAENISPMWETIGRMYLLFPATTEIDELVNQIRQIEKKFEDFGNDMTKDPISNVKTEYSTVSFSDINFESWLYTKQNELRDWYNNKYSRSKELTDELETSIDELLNALKYEIQKNNQLPDVMGGHPITIS